MLPNAHLLSRRMLFTLLFWSALIPDIFDLRASTVQISLLY